MLDYETTLEKWKIQLTISINYISSKDDSDEICFIRTKSDNIEIMKGSETDEIIDEIFESLLQNYKKDLEESMRGSKFTFNTVDLLCYHLQKTCLKRATSSYTDSPKWLTYKKTTPKSKDNNCFQYASTSVLNYQNIKTKQKEYLILSLLLIITVGKEEIFHQNEKKTRKSLNKIASQLLLILYLCHKILKK